MKKIMFVTKHKIFAQSLANVMKTRPELCFEPYLLSDIRQAALDAEVLRADVVILDISDMTDRSREEVMELCENLRKTIPNCRLILLLPHDDGGCRQIAIDAAQNAVVDDFVYHNETMDYFFAKIEAV